MLFNHPITLYTAFLLSWASAIKIEYSIQNQPNETKSLELEPGCHKLDVKFIKIISISDAASVTIFNQEDCVGTLVAKGVNGTNFNTEKAAQSIKVTDKAEPDSTKVIASTTYSPNYTPRKSGFFKDLIGALFLSHKKTTEDSNKTDLTSKTSTMGASAGRFIKKISKSIFKSLVSDDGPTSTDSKPSENDSSQHNSGTSGNFFSRVIGFGVKKLAKYGILSSNFVSSITSNTGNNKRGATWSLIKKALFSESRSSTEKPDSKDSEHLDKKQAFNEINKYVKKHKN